MQNVVIISLYTVRTTEIRDLIAVTFSLKPSIVRENSFFCEINHLE